VEDEEQKDGDKDQYLESLLDDYYNLDFEDLIGGGSVKTRFKYRKVASEDFGLTEDEILLLDDKQLNKLVSLKKYRSYIDMQTGAEDESMAVKRKHNEITEKVNIHRVKHLKKQLEGELKEKRKMLKYSLQQSLEQEKEKYFGESAASTAAA
jgi:protein KRI1